MNWVNEKLFVLMLGTAFILPVFANNGSEMDRQGQFMAVYLFHFSNFIEWPESSFNDSENFNICINGNTELNNYIHEIEGESVKDKKIKIHKYISEQDINRCQILFVSRIGGFNLEQLEIKNKSILLVSDRNGFIDGGGVIEYFIKNNKLRIAINLQLAKRKKLKISSKLLQIAKIVGGKE